ncbi:class D beta-lactamase [Pelagicoccus albus]|uniref:beta-lactamase n=1 Tax=Pelagicoccus albus TaxID=415222 RepID=A0A7X1B3J5_9BACT|nr:class D beta-lactamase [Pelagicoccus albus]MBC2604862.1 class D beta-lactamase [Pelagicoccus albus]
MKRIILTLVACCSIGLEIWAAEKPIEPFPKAKEILSETGYRGTILIYDLDHDTYHASGPAIADERFIPASTFKILSAQAALQSGVIANASTIIPWDGVVRGRQETNQDLDLTHAFRISAVPHFQSLVRKIGYDQMQAYIDSIPYGNQSIEGGIDKFWLTGKLRISPREQIQFLTNLYHNKLPFDQSVMDAVKEMLRNPEEPETQYFAKTGWATLENNLNVGWWVGWAVRDDRRLFFATVIESPNPADNFGLARIETTREALDEAFQEFE